MIGQQKISLPIETELRGFGDNVKGAWSGRRGCFTPKLNSNMIKFKKMISTVLSGPYFNPNPSYLNIF